MWPLKITFWQRNDIGVIFTDIDMPGSMDGLKLAHFVKGRWPPIKIIATSGHAKITENDLPEGVRFMPKPYNPTEIADTIDQLISSRVKCAAHGDEVYALVAGVFLAHRVIPLRCGIWS